MKKESDIDENKREKILWVDDEPDNLLYEKFCIEHNTQGKRYEVVMVSSINQAVKKLNSEHYVGIILDQQIEQTHIPNLSVEEISYSGASVAWYLKNWNVFHSDKENKEKKIPHEVKTFLDNIEESRIKDISCIKENSKINIAVVTSVDNKGAHKFIMSINKTDKPAWIKKPVNERALMTFVQSL